MLTRVRVLHKKLSLMKTTNPALLHFNWYQLFRFLQEHEQFIMKFIWKEKTNILKTRSTLHWLATKAQTDNSQANNIVAFNKRDNNSIRDLWAAYIDALCVCVNKLSNACTFRRSGNIFDTWLRPRARKKHELFIFDLIWFGKPYRALFYSSIWFDFERK